MSSSPAHRLLLVLGLVAALSACRQSSDAGALSCVARFRITPPAGTYFRPRQVPALSPDGSHLAAIATDARGTSRLWIQSLGPPAAEPAAGPEGASFPFWSPDGRQLGFFTAGRLERIDRAGAVRTTIAQVVDGHGGSWGPDGTILFSAGTGPSIFSVAADGGAARQLTNLGDRARGRHVWPVFLPDGTHFLYLSIDENDEAQTLLGSLRSADRDVVLGGSSPVAYLAPGGLLFGRGSALLASPFDPNVLQPYGKVTAIAHPIARGPSGLAAFGASADGSVVVYADDGSETVWVDAAGHEAAAVPEAGARPRLSPSGDRILVSLSDAGLYGVYDTTLDRWFGGESEESSPGRWGPDGTEVLVTSIGPGRTRIVARRVDGSGAARTLFDEAGAFHSAATASARGGLLAVFERQAGPERRLRVVTLAGKGSLAQRTIWQLAIRGREGPPAISPDGRWLAYSQNESGAGVLYVSPLDGAPSAARVSPGGTRPVWSGDGRQLFYRTGRGIVAVPVEGAPGDWGARERLVISEPVLRVRSYHGDEFEVSQDGTRVLLLKSGRVDGPVALKGLRSCGPGIATLFPR